jgi:hypothetical protein
MSRRTASLVTSFASVIAIALPHTAMATGVVTGGQWVRDIHAGAPVGTRDELANASVVGYFIQLNNPSGQSIPLTVVWTVNGREGAPLQVSTTWHATWVFRGVTNDTRELAISIRDAEGTVLHTDQITFQRTGSDAPARR